MRGFVSTEHVGRPTWLQYLLVFLVLLVSVSWIADIGSNWIQYPLYILLLVTIPFVRKPRYSRIFIIWFSVFVIATLAVLIAQQGLSERSSVFFLANMAIAFLVVGVFRGQGVNFWRCFNDLIFILTVISLCLYPLVFAKDILVELPRYLLTESEIKIHRDLFTAFGLSYYVTSGSVTDIWRNQAIFWEPGMHASMLILALLFSQLVGESKRRKVVYVVGVVSTFAVGGYAILAVLIGFWMLYRISKRQMFFVVIMVVIFIFAYIGIELIQRLVFFLFDRDIQNDASVFIRSADLWLPFITALDSPFWGHPNIAHYSISMMDAIDRAMVGITNSLGAYFYKYGLIWGG